MQSLVESTSLRTGAAWVVAWRMVGIATTFAANVLAARVLGPAGFGVFLLITTVIALGSLLAMGGMNEAGLRFISESLGLGRPSLAHAYSRKVMRWTIVTSTSAAGVVVLGLIAFQAVTGKFDQPALIISLAAGGVMVLAWQQTAADALRGYGDLRRASLISGGQTGGPVSNLLFLAAVGAAALYYSHVEVGLVVGLLIASIGATMPLALLSLRRTRGPSPVDAAELNDAGRQRLSPGQDRQLLAAATSLLAIQLLTFATYQLDIWIGSGILTSDDVGLYGVAKRCQLLAQIPVQMAMLTVIATIPRLCVQNRMAELERVARRAATLAAIPAVAVLAVLAIFPEAILQTLFGGSFSGAAPVILPLAVGQLAHVLFGNPAYVLSMTGHHRTVVWINVVAVVVLIAVGVVGARSAGPVGLAIGSAACLTVQNGLLWWFARRRLGIWTHVGGRSWTVRSVALPDSQRSRSEGDEIERALAPNPSTGTRTPAVKQDRAILRRLWWLHPAWPFAGVVGTTILAAWFQADNAYAIYGTPKYVEFEHVAMAFAAIAVFIVGCGLGQSTGRTPRATQLGANGTIRFWFYLTTTLTLFGYFAWFAVGFKNGFRLNTFVDLVTGADANSYDVIRHELFPTIPGVTTCTQFGIAAVLFGSWLLVHGQRRVIWPLAMLMALAAVRCLLFSERTALIELFFPPAMVGLRAWILGRSQRPVVRWLLGAAPVLCIFGVVLFFGVFEYFRSWMWYRDQFASYAEFTLWRLSGYFTTAHNNGAMALVTDQPRPLPYFTLRPLWEFPGVSDSPLGYKALTGVDVPLTHINMLHRYGTYELNNEGGLFQPALDFGWAGFLVYWFGYGFISARVYRAFLVGTFAGVMLYPLVYMSLLEVPLILFLMYTRVFPSLVAIGIAAWFASRATSPVRADGCFADAVDNNNGVLHAH